MADMGGRGGSSGLTTRHIAFKDNFRDADTNKKVRNMISDLTQEYKNFLSLVQKGGNELGIKGSVDLIGVMELSTTDDATIYHEFAHAIANTKRDSIKMSYDREFWNEIKKIRTQYRKAVLNDSRNEISGYADSMVKGKHSLDEFFAEGFSLGKMRSAGKKIKRSSGLNDTPQAGKWADMIVATTDKYFKKRKKR